MTAPLRLTTSSVVLFYCSGGPTEWGILGDVVHDTIPGPGLGLHRLGLEEISGDRRWLSLGNAVLETGVAQICHEGFSITVADADSCLAAPLLRWLRHILVVLGCRCSNKKYKINYKCTKPHMLARIELKVCVCAPNLGSQSQSCMNSKIRISNSQDLPGERHFK